MCDVSPDGRGSSDENRPFFGLIGFSVFFEVLLTAISNSFTKSHFEQNPSKTTRLPYGKHCIHGIHVPRIPLTSTLLGHNFRAPDVIGPRVSLNVSARKLLELMTRPHPFKDHVPDSLAGI